MICLLHGYLLDGSGSNLWTQSMVRALCGAGQTIHLMCQEPHPEDYDFISQFIRYDEKLNSTTVFERPTAYPGRCIMHKPTLGSVLPVFVWDRYEEFSTVVPMVELDDAVIEDYVSRNYALLEKMATTHQITAVHANHVSLQARCAQRLFREKAIPYSVMPHGSEIEYAVKSDPRFNRQGLEIVREASAIFVHGPEMRRRVLDVFHEAQFVDKKIVELNLGVNTSTFDTVAPAARPKHIARLAEALIPVERGKRPEQSSTMRHQLGDALSREVLRKILTQASDYSARHVDADTETKLQSIDWEKDKILIFVGRLIVSKGAHTVVAALSEILQKEPRARLIVVGHGPLREALEAMLWALDHGKRQLFENIVAWGKYLEGQEAPEPLHHVRHYLDELRQAGRLEQYFQSAQEMHMSERVVFTGYLTHRELGYLFPCGDVAVFPSIVPEAGPLVFLEAMASGVFPLGVYQGGMAASIDAVGETVPAQVRDLMKLPTDEKLTVAQIVEHVLAALQLGRAYTTALRQVAINRYDWTTVGNVFKQTLERMGGKV